MRTVISILSVLFCASSAHAVDRRDLAANDPRHNVRELIRIIPVGDESVFVISRSSAGEDHSMAGRLIEKDVVVAELRAAGLVPAAAVMPGTAGQVFGAAILDGGNLAVSIGWTNRNGRNINGIALLEQKAGSWKAYRVIVLRGSVRDLAPGPDGGIVAATTDIGPGGEGKLAVLLLDTSGRIRATVVERTSTVEDVEQRIMHVRLQRLPGRSIAIFDLSAGSMHLHQVTPGISCDATVETRGHDVFRYPRYRKSSCDSASLVRLLAIGDVPREAATLDHLTIDAVRLHDDGGFTVVRHGYDGRRSQTIVTTVGQGGGSLKLQIPIAARSVWLSDERLHAVSQTAGGFHHVTLPIRSSP